MNTVSAIILMVCLTSDQTSHLIEHGMDRFRQGRVAESLAQFDRAIEVDQRVKPYLWQRGISQYCLGDFSGGRQQFEIHRKVNPNDVENAAWHYLCVVKTDGQDVARQSLIPIKTEFDRRAPMKEIYEYLAGTATEDEVLRAANQADTPLSRMYAHLYLGLCDDVEGNTEQAMRHLKIASTEKLKDSYMQDVAKVILGQRLNIVKSQTELEQSGKEN